MTTVAARGLAPGVPLGQLETASGLAGSLRPPAPSPGCCRLTNIVRPSGVTNAPVTSWLKILSAITPAVGLAASAYTISGN